MTIAITLAGGGLTCSRAQPVRVRAHAAVNQGTMFARPRNGAAQAFLM